jgi:hypothetical protein
VGDHDERHPGLLAEVAQQVEDLGLDRDVERRGGLVGDQYLGLPRQGARDGDPLGHAARELVGVLGVHRPRVRQADLLEQRQSDVAGPLAADPPMVTHCLGDLVARGEHGVEAGDGLLGDVGDAAAPVAVDVRLVEGREVGPVEKARAGAHRRARGGHAQDRRDGHGLATAGLADDPQRLAGSQVEAHVVDDQGPRGAEVHRQVAHGKQRRMVEQRYGRTCGRHNVGGGGHCAPGGVLGGAPSAASGIGVA